MARTLHMLRLQPDMLRVSAWAHQEGLVGRGGDLGYAMHALLSAAFGPHAPKPFRLHESRRWTVLYGYTDSQEEDLREHAHAFTDPEVITTLDLAKLAVKAMPTSWSSGRKLGFELRVRPVVRQDKEGNRKQARELDAFLVACEQAGDDNKVNRAGVYGDWLAEQLVRNDGARLVSSRLVAFRRSRVGRRNRERRLSTSEGPDAVLSGILEVKDGDAFSALLRRGIGRHRAFGYGMLLLRPASPGIG